MIKSEQDYRLAVSHSPKGIIRSCRIKNENYKMPCFLKRKSSYLVSYFLNATAPDRHFPAYRPFRSVLRNNVTLLLMLQSDRQRASAI